MRWMGSLGAIRVDLACSSVVRRPGGRPMRRFLAPLLACAFGVVAGAAPVAQPLSLVPSAQAASACLFSMHRIGATCVLNEHPETFADMAAASGQYAAMNTVPRGTTQGQAYRAALRQRHALAASSASAVPGTGGKWSPLGKGPLIAADPR